MSELSCPKCSGKEILKKEPICEKCGHEAYSHNWTSESLHKHTKCIGENPYWSGCNCSGFQEKVK